MPIDLRPPTPDDTPELGRILYEAFKDISESHGFPPDFPTLEFAQQIAGLLIQQETVYGVAAADGAKLLGSNFMNLAGDVAGIGPISVDIASQGGGIGRKLMQDAIAHARATGHDMVRLCQDSFNMRSLALYSSVGFDTKEPLALLDLAATGTVDPALCPAAQSDLDAMDALCRDVYRVSRKGECALIMGLGFPAFVIDRGGVRGYITGTILGHAVAETDDDLLALLAGMGVNAPGAEAFIPLRNGELYRRALAAGHRNRKVMNLMAIGPYDDPQGPYAPSVLF